MKAPVHASGFLRLCVAGLEKMYFPAEHLFATSYRAADGAMVHVRSGPSDYTYTMNCLLGLSRARSSGSEIFTDPERAYHELVRRADDHICSVEGIAATVWTGRCLGAAVPPEMVSLLRRALEDTEATPRLTAQGLAWSILACTIGGDADRDAALDLAALATSSYVHPETCLVRHASRGLRKDWASFAASCYMAYALLCLGRATARADLTQVGLRIARALVRLQGSQGQWGWFYHVPSGRLADLYPVYSVHQHAMAPFFLLQGIDQGYEEFREPLVRGFRWILGRNELGAPMADPRLGIIWRSVTRRGSFSRLGRVARAAGTRYTGARARAQPGTAVQVSRECRSYELGWALWAFAGRGDFDDLLNDSSFCGN